jgi:hypothetical protein
MDSGWGQGVWSALVEVGDRLAAIVPALLVMLTLVVVGLVLGLIARVVLTRLARAIALDRHLERWGLASSIRRSGILRTPTDLLGVVAFWAIFVLFASLGIDALGVRSSGSAAAFLLGFLPPLFAATLILVVGWVIANFLSQGLLIAAVNAGLPEARLLARAAHWGVVLFAIATALTHLGIGKEIILVAFGITLGGLVFAVALAFGLAGRHFARALLARRLRRETAPDHERLTQL